MLLDLNQSDQQLWARPKPNEGTRLPSTDADGFEAAWNEGLLFSQSSASSMAQHRALMDYRDEVRQKTGQDITPDLAEIVVNSDWSKAAATIAKLNAANPDLRLDAPTPETISQRAVVLSRQARQTYQQNAAGEGGGFGRFLGGLASAATDPINVAAAPLGGGEAGILMTALKFGGLAAASQVANEAVQEGFREKVQPGYGASGEPAANILEAGASGAILGGGLKALGSAWTRVKTGTWPTTVRDAGNLVESEANVRASNVYPGAAGEAAHRDALGSAIDSITKGDPVDVAAHITPEVEASTRVPKTAFIEQKGDADFMVKSSENPGDLMSLAVRPDAVQVGMSTVGRQNRGQGVGVALYEKAIEFAAERGLPLRSDISVSADADRVYQALRRRGYQVTEAPGTDTVEKNGSKINVSAGYVYQVEPNLEIAQARAAATAAAARIEREAAAAGPSPELPFKATATEAQADGYVALLREHIAAEAERGGHVLAPDEIAALADRFARMTPEDAADAIRDLRVRPHQMAAEPAPGRAAEATEPPATTYRQADVDRMLSSPEHEQALRGDLDRARATSDVKIPAGIDAEGNPVFRSLDSALDEVDAFKKAADEIQACAAPVQQEAAE